MMRTTFMDTEKSLDPLESFLVTVICIPRILFLSPRHVRLSFLYNMKLMILRWIQAVLPSNINIISGLFYTRNNTGNLARKKYVMCSCVLGTLCQQVTSTFGLWFFSHLTCTTFMDVIWKFHNHILIPSWCIDFRMCSRRRDFVHRININGPNYDFLVCFRSDAGSWIC